jgi:hypothetical protein
MILIAALHHHIADGTISDIAGILAWPEIYRIHEAP